MSIIGNGKKVIEKFLPKDQRTDLSKIKTYTNTFSGAGDTVQIISVPLTQYLTAIAALEASERLLQGLETIIEKKLPIKPYSDGYYNEAIS